MKNYYVHLTEKNGKPFTIKWKAPEDFDLKKIESIEFRNDTDIFIGYEFSLAKNFLNLQEASNKKIKEFIKEIKNLRKQLKFYKSLNELI